MSGVFYHSVIHGLGFLICFKIKSLRAKNKKTAASFSLHGGNLTLISILFREETETLPESHRVFNF